MKILTIGDSSVGKTCLILRSIENCFTHELRSTIGVECKSKIIERGTKRISVQLWDTAGQERYRRITANYYRGSHGVAIVYDVTNRKSFELVTTWIDELKKQASQNTINILVANKTDMLNLRVVQEDEGRELAKQWNLDYFETSAKTGAGVNEAFNYLIDKIYASMEVSPQFLKKTKESFLLASQKGSFESKKRCC
ncbi:unnamed protein product [Blepharisma stoltei]|uniref:Uncharacterized protein n=1 Tax=Blepharisma stoltei TaxID=1481888 RepID=A0AAU9K8D1_9CILI|nr:unnamed protein product [Blepharisma stoltei]